MQDLITPLETESIRIFLSVIMLGIASFLDFKKRQVHDLLWIVFGVIAAILVLVEYDMTSFLIQTGLSVAITVPITFLMWRLGLFGGADAFAIIIISALAPFSTISDSAITPFTLLTNAGILALSTLIINATKNLTAILKKEDIFYGFDETNIRKTLAFFLGTRSRNPKYSFSIQKYNGYSKKFNFSHIHAEKSDFCTAHDSWVTPGIPFIMYIFAGFVVQVIFGDLLITILELFIS